MADIDQDINAGEMDEANAESKTETENTAETEAAAEDARCDETQQGAAAEGKEILSMLSQLGQQLETLQECFNDKIAEDAHKNELFDNMHRELVKYQNGIMDKIVETLALDIIQLIDATKANVRIYEQKEPNEDNYKRLLKTVKGISQDLEDILYRQSIESYRVAGHEVDVKRQKIIQTVETDDERKHNLVAVRSAEGYEKDGKVIRPERIKIFKYVPGNKEE